MLLFLPQPSLILQRITSSPIHKYIFQALQKGNLMSGDDEGEDVVMDVLVAESSLEDEVEKALEKFTETRLSSVSESAASESTSTTQGFVISESTTTTAVTNASASATNVSSSTTTWEAFDGELAIVEAKVAGVEDELSSNLAQTIDLTKDDDENIYELNHKVSSVQMSLAKLVEQSEKMMNVDGNDEEGDGKTTKSSVDTKRTDQRAEAVEALQVC